MDTENNIDQILDKLVHGISDDCSTSRVFDSFSHAETIGILILVDFQGGPMFYSMAHLFPLLLLLDYIHSQKVNCSPSLLFLYGIIRFFFWYFYASGTSLFVIERSLLGTRVG